MFEIVFLIFALGSVYFLYKGSVDGEVKLQDGRTYTRTKNPGMYWFSQIGNAVVLVIILIIFAALSLK